MATIKSYSDLQQSKKLAEILPIESANMDYIPVVNTDGIDGDYSITVNKWDNDHIIEEGWIPCWSLAALLGVIRETIGCTLYGVNNVYISCGLGDKPWELETKVHDNEIDACCELILKLNELNLL